MFYTAPETRALEAALEGAHLVFELHGRTISPGRFVVDQSHGMPIPHKEVMFVDIAELDAELMQPAQRLLAPIYIYGPRAFHPLGNEANHTLVFPLSSMA